MKHLLCALGMALAWCNSQQPQPAPPPPAPSDEPPSCVTACNRMRQLSCPEAAPTDEGATCEMVCENAAASPAPLPVACMTHAISCPALERCE